MLSEHPDVSGFRHTGVVEDEGQHLQSVYPPVAEFGGPGEFGLDPRSYMDENHALANEDSAEQLLRDWERYWDADARILVEKSPGNIVRSRFLQALFPNARFVFIVRHPVAVSLATEKWTHKGMRFRFRNWLACHEQLGEDAPHLQHGLILRYEDLMADPENAVKRVQRFADLYPKTPDIEVKPAISERYYALWRKRSKGLFRGHYYKRLTDSFSSAVSVYGYDLVDLEALHPSGFFREWHLHVER